MVGDSRSGLAILAENDQSLLDQTLAAAVKDQQTSSPKGKKLEARIEGVSFRELPVHPDARGSVMEMLDPRWNWHPDPIVFTYCFTIRPGFVKGLESAQGTHQDRYVLLQGEMELVMYDVRPTSSTYGKLSRIVLSEYRRGIVNVPTYVWHADNNIGTRDVLVVSFPTKAYNHANPDKYRLPLDSPLIPYRFEGARGW
jgi:dTDP-4-dehydrorhamnose 3,5-epimerase